MHFEEDWWCNFIIHKPHEQQQDGSANKIFENVRNYYGKVLSSSKDLKTSACCTLDKPHATIREIMNKWAWYRRVMPMHVSVWDLTIVCAFARLHVSIGSPRLSWIAITDAVIQFHLESMVCTWWTWAVEVAVIAIWRQHWYQLLLVLLFIIDLFCHFKFYNNHQPWSIGYCLFVCLRFYIDKSLNSHRWDLADLWQASILLMNSCKLPLLTSKNTRKHSSKWPSYCIVCVYVEEFN